MQLQTFKAATMAEALTQVKSVMGADAIILHTRTFQVRSMLGLRRQEIVEITAGKGMNIGNRARRGGATPPVNGNATGNGNGPARPAAAAAPTYNRLGAPVRPMVETGEGARESIPRDPAPRNGAARDLPPRTAADGGRGLLESPAGTSAAVLGLSQEINALKVLMKDLIVATNRQRVPEVPADLLDYYTQLIQNEVAEELATEVVKTIQKQVRPERFAETQYINEKIAEQLEKIIPTAGPLQRTKKDGPHVVALIGPTGVGKTTTIAKLAANLKLRDRQRVGLITLDTYRIAAVDQLKRYADIIGAPLRVVSGAEELKDALAALNDQEFILIDTAGRSPHDAMKLNELRTMLEAANPDEVHLVLSTTASQEAVELAVARFGEVRVDKIIFTKVDEAAHLGVVLNVAHKINKSLSYITTGQDVPNDIEVGQSRRLAQMILGRAK